MARDGSHSPREDRLRGAATTCAPLRARPDRAAGTARCRLLGGRPQPAPCAARSPCALRMPGIRQRRPPGRRALEPTPAFCALAGDGQGPSLRHRAAPPRRADPASGPQDPGATPGRGRPTTHLSRSPIGGCDERWPASAGAPESSPARSEDPENAARHRMRGCQDETTWSARRTRTDRVFATAPTGTPGSRRPSGGNRWSRGGGSRSVSAFLHHPMLACDAP